MRLASIMFSVLVLAAAGCGDSERPQTQANTATIQPASAPDAGAGDPLTVQLVAGEQRVSSVGTGRCTHAPQAAIYNVPASLWQVEHSGSGGELSSLNLTVWRPTAGGPDQFSLAAQVGDRQHRVDTVKGAQNVGSGTLTMHPQGEGARFEIEAVDETGGALRVTVQCTRFAGIQPEGG